MKSPTSKKQQFNRILFTWYKKHGRDSLAWRKTRDPFCILVSEVMLQQTQVDRVRAKYQEFLRAFPTVRVLAKAQLGSVLKIWSGLGYNRRAKYLKNCAEVIVHKHKGKFPRTFGELVELPGIGISTAAAICAFAYNHEEPMIDTNIRRVLCRVFFPKGIPSDKTLYTFAKTMISKGKGREWNYAMLDIGALKCTARNHTKGCPLIIMHGKVGDFIYKKPQKKFHDSDRYYRGRILATLINANKHSISTVRMKEVLGLSKERFNDIIVRLEKEEMILVRSNHIVLP